MAEIRLEKKKRGMGWLWALLALLLLLLLVWWLWPDDAVEEPVATEPYGSEVEPVGPVEPVEPMVSAEGLGLGVILANPADYVGQPFPGAEVQVAEVPTDRGFWIEQDGQRLFAIIIDGPEEQPKDINPGQTLDVTQGTLRDSSYLAELPGEPLDADTEEIARQQPIFLVVDERYIEVLEGGEPQPGTDPAEGVEPS